MSTQTPELNTARVNKNVGNDTAIESNDESENNNKGRSGTGRYNRISRGYLGMKNDSNSRQFEGAEPKVGAVLALSSERIDKKLPFEQFKDKLVNYVGREFPNGDDIVCIIKSHKDPKPAFDKKHLPEELSEEDKKSDIKVKIQSERIKRYVVKEDELKSSLNKLYNIIWGQCSDQLQATVKFLNDYNTKEEGKDFRLSFNARPLASIH